MSISLDFQPDSKVDEAFNDFEATQLPNFVSIFKDKIKEWPQYSDPDKINESNDENSISEEIQVMMMSHKQFFVTHAHQKDIGSLEIKKLLNKSLRVSHLMGSMSKDVGNHYSEFQLAENPMSPSSAMSPLDLDRLTLQVSDYQNLVEVLKQKLKILCQHHSNEFDQGMKNINFIVK